MIFLLILIILAVTAISVTGIVGFTRHVLDENRTNLLESKRQQVEAERALDKAERTLRNIYHGAGNPVLEAEIGLDEISAYHVKELNE